MAGTPAKVQPQHTPKTAKKSENTSRLMPSESRAFLSNTVVGAVPIASSSTSKLSFSHIRELIAPARATNKTPEINKKMTTKTIALNTVDWSGGKPIHRRSLEIRLEKRK